MLSRVVSTTLPAANCSSWWNWTANTEVMDAAGQHSSSRMTCVTMPQRKSPSAAKAAMVSTGMKSIRTTVSFQMCLSVRVRCRSPEAMSIPVMSMERGVFMSPRSSMGWTMRSGSGIWSR